MTDTPDPDDDTALEQHGRAVPESAVPESAVSESAVSESADTDELVSAVLDGEATDDEIALVEANPTLTARLATLRSIQHAHIAAVLDAGRSEADDVDRRIEAALAAAPSSATPSTATTHTAALDTANPVSAATPSSRSAAAPTVSLFRSNPAGRRRRMSPLAAAAAAILVIGITAVAFTSLGNRDDRNEAAVSDITENTTITTPAPNLDKDAESGGLVGAQGDESDASADKATAGAPTAPSAGVPVRPSNGAGAGRDRSIVDLGDFSTLPALIAAATDTPTSGAGTLPCPSPFPPGTTVHVGAARLSGRAVVVMIDAPSEVDTAPRAADPAFVVVLDQSTCERVN